MSLMEDTEILVSDARSTVKYLFRLSVPFYGPSTPLARLDQVPIESDPIKLVNGAWPYVSVSATVVGRRDDPDGGMQSYDLDDGSGTAQLLVRYEDDVLRPSLMPDDLESVAFESGDRVRVKGLLIDDSTLRALSLVGGSGVTRQSDLYVSTHHLETTLERVGSGPADPVNAHWKHTRNYWRKDDLQGTLNLLNPFF